MHDCITTARKLLLLGLLAASLSRCDLAPKPVAPTWEAELNLPLISKKYTVIEELTRQSEDFLTDADGNVFLNFSSEIDTFTARDQMRLRGLAQTFTQALGVFRVETQTMRMATIQFQDIYPPAAQFDGSSAPVPPFAFNIPRVQLENFDSFQWVQVAAGTIDVEVTNNLPVTLGMPLAVQLRDAGSDTVIANSSLPAPVAANGGRGQVVFDLAGKRMGSSLVLAVFGSSPGSPATPVQLNATDDFLVTLRLSDFDVTAAAAKIGSRQITGQETLTISDSLLISSARIRQGMVTISVGGEFPVDLDAGLVLPHFVDASQQPLRTTIVLRAGQLASVELDLAGYSLRPRGQEFARQQIDIDWLLTSRADADEIVELHASDEFSVLIVLSELQFAEFAGAFDRRRVPLPAQQFTLDLPSEIADLSVSFADARLELLLHNSIYFPAIATITLVGRNEAGQQATLDFQASIQPGTANGNPVTTTVVLDRSNSTVLDFVNLLPTSIEVQGEVAIGDAGWIGRVRDSDIVRGDVRLVTPLTITLPVQRLDSEITRITIDPEVQRRITDHVLEGRLRGSVENHLPAAASLDLLFAATESAVFTAPAVAIDSIAVPAGSIGSDGSVTLPGSSELDVALSKEQIDFLARDVVFAGLRIRLAGSGGQTIRILASDYLDLKAYAAFKLYVDENIVK